MSLRIDVVFDLPPEATYHRATLEAVGHAANAANVETEIRVVRTTAIDDAYFTSLPDAVVIGPGTPYEDPSRAEAVIRTAREKGLPLVGT